LRFNSLMLSASPMHLAILMWQCDVDTPSSWLFSTFTIFNAFGNEVPKTKRKFLNKNNNNKKKKNYWHFPPAADIQQVQDPMMNVIYAGEDPYLMEFHTYWTTSSLDPQCLSQQRSLYEPEIHNDKALVWNSASWLKAVSAPIFTTAPPLPLSVLILGFYFTVVEFLKYFWSKKCDFNNFPT